MNYLELFESFTQKVINDKRNTSQDNKRKDILMPTDQEIYDAFFTNCKEENFKDTVYYANNDEGLYPFIETYIKGVKVSYVLPCSLDVYDDEIGFAEGYWEYFKIYINDKEYNQCGISFQFTPEYYHCENIISWEELDNDVLELIRQGGFLNNGQYFDIKFKKTNRTSYDNLEKTGKYKKLKNEKITRLFTDFVFKHKSSSNFVDLGLPSGTLWKKFDVGANKEGEYGNFYTYEEIKQMKLNNSVKLPTDVEFQELLDNCEGENIKYQGVMGLMFKSKINGEFIFFPFAGYMHAYFDDYRKGKEAKVIGYNDIKRFRDRAVYFAGEENDCPRTFDIAYSLYTSKSKRHIPGIMMCVPYQKEYYVKGHFKMNIRLIK